MCKVNFITDFFPNLKPMRSPLSEESMIEQQQDRFYLPEASFVREGTFVLQEKFYTDTLELESSLKFIRAGARK